MSKGLVVTLAIIGVILVFVFGFFMWGTGIYDNAVKAQENVNKEWNDVEANYQRRADLIPNLVNTVKGYADFEKTTLTEVVEARSKATSVQVDPSNMTPEKFQQFQQAQNGLSSALGRLLVVIEKYPDLKANQNFLDLQAQLEGTENRINVARQRYNDAVANYNTYVRGYFKKMALSMFGSGEDFTPRKGFEAARGAENAPTVKF